MSGALVGRYMLGGLWPAYNRYTDDMPITGRDMPRIFTGYTFLGVAIARGFGPWIAGPGLGQREGLCIRRAGCVTLSSITNIHELGEI